MSAIAVTSRCGRSFWARGSDAGRRAKCPACGEIVTIPGRRASCSANHSAQTSSTALVASASPSPAEAPSAAPAAASRRATSADGTKYSKEEIRKKHRWLYIPFLSWVFLVFPLITPPIPLGPIMIFWSWNRRRWISFIKRSMAHLGRKPAEHGFPIGGLLNTIINVLDVLTLGLSHLFVTAHLLHKMVRADGTADELSEGDPLLWVVKWLFLGNVAFLALYVVCPGLIFERLLVRLESHLHHAHEAVRETTAGPTTAGTDPICQPA